MKNHYFFKQTRIILLFVLFLSGFTAFSQSSKKVIPAKSAKTVISNTVEKNPMLEVAQIKKETPEVPFNYTATKVSLSSNASPEAKSDFLAKYNAGYYYVYSDDKGKTISIEELQEALRIEKSKSTNKTQTINPKN